MDIKDSYLHGTVGVVKSISVDADKLTYKLADTGGDGSGTVNEVTLPSMVAATSNTDGKPGLVPTPSANSLDKYLKGDGTWSDVDAAKLGGINPIGFMRVKASYDNKIHQSANDMTNSGSYRLENKNEGLPLESNYGNVLVVRGLTGASYGDTLAQMFFPYLTNAVYLRTGNTGSGSYGFTNREWSRFVLGDDKIKTTSDTDKGVKVELSGTFDEPQIDVTTTFGDVAISNSSNAVSGETIAKSVPLLNGGNGTLIPSNSDLNSLGFCDNVGTYYSSSDANTQTLTNCPTPYSFVMYVHAPLGWISLSKTWAYRIRKITNIKGHEWIQEISSDGNTINYRPWCRILRADTTFSKATKSTANGTQVVNAGTGGAVPAPQTLEDNSKFLKGDGTWAIPSVSGKVSNDLTLKINSGTTEGTSLYTYNGSAAKTLNIKNGTGIGFTNTAGVLSIYNSGVRSISTGTANGTISVNTNGTSTNVAVKGLGSAAYTNTNLYQKQAQFNSPSSDTAAYKKVTITKSNLDGYGIWIHSRQQHYLINSGVTAGTSYLQVFYELNTLYNSVDISTNRIINVKTIATYSSSTITLYIASSGYNYVQIVSAGDITISDSTKTEFDSITSSTTGWIPCTTAKWTDTTYNVVSNSANGLAPKVINTNTATVGNAYYVLASTNGSATPSWYKLPSNAFANDDTKVTLTNTTGSADYRVLFSGNANDTTETTTARKSANLKFNPNTGNLSTETLLITRTTNAKHILFSRGSDTDYPYNYIAAPTGGKICILPNGVSNESSLGMHFDDTGLHPATTQAYSLGTSSYKWSSVYAGTFIGNLDGTYVNKLTGYTKATTKGAIAATDTLNVALGKLEFKADVAYDLVKGAYDGDGTIENLAEILKVLEGIKDTETIQAIIGKYLPLTGGTLTGKLTIEESNFGSLIIYRKDSANSASIQFKNGSNVSLGYLGMNTANGNLFRFSADTSTSYKIWDSGNDGSGSGLNADLLDGTHKADLLASATSTNTTNLSITVGGTTKNITNLYARQLGLSSNTITSTTDDTTAKWGPLGTSVHFYNTKDQLTDQPLLYGLLLNLSNHFSEVHQIWMTQSSGNLYHRGGNSAGWSGSWRTILDSVNTHIKSGVITINGTTITPLTQHQSLANYVTLDTALTITGIKTFSNKIKFLPAADTDAGASIYSEVVSGATNLIFFNTNDSTDGFIFRSKLYSNETDTDILTIQYSGITSTSNITSPKFITSGGTSSQFVKGDGSLDSNKYLINTHATNTSAYYRTIKVNGTDYAFWSHISNPTFTIYAPNTAGTKDLVLVSNGSGAPVWSDYNSVLPVKLINDPGRTVLIKSYGLNADFGTEDYGAPYEEYLQAFSKYLLDKAAGYTCIGYIRPSSRSSYICDVYDSGINDTTGLPLHITGHCFQFGGTHYHFGTSYGAWYYYAALHSANYTNYTVTKTGGGASGTWGIDITGNAASATTASKVTCTEASSNNDRPIVGTNMSNLLYYTQKATVNWSTGHIKAGALTINSVLDYSAYPETDTLKMGKTIGSIHFNGDLEDKGSAITWGYSSSDVADSGIYVKRNGSYGSKMYFATANEWSAGPKAAMLIDNVGDIYALRKRFNGNLKITSTTKEKHIEFSRVGYNYITAPDGGTISFAVRGDIGYVNSELHITKNVIKPGTTNRTSLGTSDLRWSNVCSVLGNFTGNVTLLSASGDSPSLVFLRGVIGTDTTIDWRLYVTAGHLIIQNALSSVDSGAWKNVLHFDADLANKVLTSSYHIVPVTNNTLTLGTSSLRWNYIYGKYGNFTNSITSSLTTSTHLAGNLGVAIINSTASGNGYTMLAKMNSTNGVFCQGTYKKAYNFYYTVQTAIDEETNTCTKILTLLNESGNSLFPGNITALGFKKSESSDSYVLLGGGGHKTISSLSVASAITADYLKPTKIVSGVKFNLSNASWTDTGYTFASLTTGTYAVQVTSGSNLVASGIMSVYTNLSDTAGDEIPLHVYGTADWRPYLRTYANKLLIASNDISETSRTVTIKIALIL